MIKEVTVDQLIKRYKRQFTDRQQEIITMAIAEKTMQQKLQKYDTNYVAKRGIELDGRFVRKIISDNNLSKAERVTLMGKELTALLQPYEWKVVTVDGDVNELRFFKSYFYDYSNDGNDTVCLQFTSVMNELLEYWLISNTMAQLSASIYITNDTNFDVSMLVTNKRPVKTNIQKLLADKRPISRFDLEMNGQAHGEADDDGYVGRINHVSVQTEPVSEQPAPTTPKQANIEHVEAERPVPQPDQKPLKIAVSEPVRTHVDAPELPPIDTRRDTFAPHTVKRQTKPVKPSNPEDDAAAMSAFQWATDQRMKTQEDLNEAHAREIAEKAVASQTPKPEVKTDSVKSVSTAKPVRPAASAIPKKPNVKPKPARALEDSYKFEFSEDFGKSDEDEFAEFDMDLEAIKAESRKRREAEAAKEQSKQMATVKAEEASKAEPEPEAEPVKAKKPKAETPKAKKATDKKAQANTKAKPAAESKPKKQDAPKQEAPAEQPKKKAVKKSKPVETTSDDDSVVRIAKKEKAPKAKKEKKTGSFMSVLSDLLFEDVDDD